MDAKSPTSEERADSAAPTLDDDGPTAPRAFMRVGVEVPEEGAPETVLRRNKSSLPIDARHD